jgi:hypothetical protein
MWDSSFSDVAGRLGSDVRIAMVVTVEWFLNDGKNVSSARAAALRKADVSSFSFSFYRDLSRSSGSFRRYV